jgi:hypothetical protein
MREWSNGGMIIGKGKQNFPELKILTAVLLHG